MGKGTEEYEMPSASHCGFSTMQLGPAWCPALNNWVIIFFQESSRRSEGRVAEAKGAYKDRLADE